VSRSTYARAQHAPRARARAHTAAWTLARSRETRSRGVHSGRGGSARECDSWLLSRGAARCRHSAARGTHGRDRLEAQADERVALRAKLPQPLCGAHLHRPKLAPRLRRDSRCSATPRPIAEALAEALAERLPHSRSAGGAAALGTHLREGHAVRRRDLHARMPQRAAADGGDRAKRELA
jgi:hypothetical protein